MTSCFEPVKKKRKRSIQDFITLQQQIAIDEIQKYEFVNEIYLRCQEHSVEASKELQECIITYMLKRWHCKANIIALKQLTSMEEKKKWKCIRFKGTKGEAFAELMRRYELKEPRPWRKWKKYFQKNSVSTALVTVLAELKILLKHMTQMAIQVNHNLMDVEQKVVRKKVNVN